MKAQDVIPAVGHNWGAWKVTKKPTETEDGTETRTCTNNPSHTETRALPKKDHAHVLVKVNAKAATVKATGTAEHYKCSVCGKLFKDAEGKTETTLAEVTVPKLININTATITGISNKTYTGKAIKPSPKVVIDGSTLKKNTDYKVSYKNNTNAGKATVTITGKGKYGGSVKKTFTIKQAANTITNVKTKYSKNLSYKKAAQKVITLSPKVKENAKITYSISSIKKGSKKIKSGFTVSKGTVKTAKKLAKGTYTVQVKINAAATKNYKAKTKTVTLTVKIK